jgi:hypothetical protein
MNLLSRPTPQDQSRPVTLTVNEERVNVLYNNASGKTVSQLFAEYGSTLGIDPARIQEYTLGNEIVPPTQVVRPGETYRGTVKSEHKGS